MEAESQLCHGCHHWSRSNGVGSDSLVVIATPVPGVESSSNRKCNREWGWDPFQGSFAFPPPLWLCFTETKIWKAQQYNWSCPTTSKMATENLVHRHSFLKSTGNVSIIWGTFNPCPPNLFQASFYGPIDPNFMAWFRIRDIILWLNC